MPDPKTTVAQLAADHLSTFGYVTEADIEFYLSAPTLDRHEKDDIQVDGLWYPSLNEWQAWDRELRDVFPGGKGMRQHPSLVVRANV